MGLIIIEKCLAALFFGAAATTLVLLHAKGITDPAQALFAKELREDPATVWRYWSLVWCQESRHSCWRWPWPPSATWCWKSLRP
jgi:hypothetical protein